MRLINADELKADLHKWFPQASLEGIEAKTLFAQILADIDNAPTVDTNEPTLNESIAFHNGYELGKSERPQGDNKEALFVLNHLFYDCDNMTHKEYDILREAIMKGGAE